MDAAGGVAARPLLPTGRLLRALGDDRLVARVRAGDDRSFETIYDRHHRGLLAFCRHMLGSREEGEDALQHTFAAAYRSLHDTTSDVQLKPWLYAIARNRCLSIIRARRDQVSLETVTPAVDGLHWQVEQRADLREMLVDLQRLPEDQRAALVLSELGAHSHEDIAMILDVRKDKVKALVFQARESLAASRRARETPCREIQEQLATLRGGALRRAPIRRHLDACDACQAFKVEVQTQRAAMAMILPAAPSVALKTAVLGPVIGGGGLAAALGAGAAGTISGTAASTGGGIAALGQGLAAKAVVATAVVASVSGGGVAVERHITHRVVHHHHHVQAAAARAGHAVSAVQIARTFTPAAPAPAPAPADAAPTRHTRAGTGHDGKGKHQRSDHRAVAPPPAAPVAVAPPPAAPVAVAPVPAPVVAPVKKHKQNGDDQGDGAAQNQLQGHDSSHNADDAAAPVVVPAPTQAVPQTKQGDDQKGDDQEGDGPQAPATVQQQVAPPQPAALPQQPPQVAAPQQKPGKQPKAARQPKQRRQQSQKRGKH